MGLESGGRGSESRFTAYVEALAAALGHTDRAAPFRSYCTGLLLPGPRKSVEPMAACVPERAMASESCTGTNFVFGGNHPDYDEYFACYDIMSGGWGGRHGADGNNCVISINGNCRFNPTEVFETRFPLRVENCELVPDSGGAGEWRGGLGFRRTLLVTQVPITGSQCSDRHEVKPWALFGGEPGGNGATFIQKAGDSRWQTVKELYGKVSTSKYSNAQFAPGDRILLITPGGGGYGDPHDRDRDRVAYDLRAGFISADAAERLYGYGPRPVSEPVRRGSDLR